MEQNPMGQNPMERNQRLRNDKRITIVIIVVLLLVAVVSFFVVAGAATAEDNFSGTYSALDAKRTTVTELMAVTAASSTAITLLPGDAGTPIADQLADLSGYFVFIMAVLCFEKWMVTVTGMLAFRILIPVACLVLIAARLLAGQKMLEMGIKLGLVALMMFAIVPASVVLTEKIDESYQASIQQMIDDTRTDAEEIQNSVGQEEDETIIEKFFDRVKGGVTGTVNKFEQTLNRMTEAIAVLIVTSCAIPIGVLLFFIWIIKLVTGVSINVPRGRFSRILPGRRPGMD